MNSGSIPVELQSLLAKLYFLSQIKSGKKPLISNMTFVEKDSWTGWFFRKWHSETRDTCVSEIDKIIEETINVIEIHKHNKNHLTILINALSGSKVGIKSMMTTYRDDPKIIGRIKVQTDNIDIQLNLYRHLIKGYEKNKKTLDTLDIEKILDNEKNKNSEKSDVDSYINFSSNNNKELFQSNKYLHERKPRKNVKPLRRPNTQLSNDNNTE